MKHIGLCYSDSMKPLEASLLELCKTSRALLWRLCNRASLQSFIPGWGEGVNFQRNVFF